MRLTPPPSAFYIPLLPFKMWLFIYIFYVFQSVYCHYGPFSYHYQSQTFPGRGSGGSSGVGMGCKSCLEVVFFFFFPQTPVTLFWYWMYVWEKASGPQCCKSQCLYRALFLNFFFYLFVRYCAPFGLVWPDEKLLRAWGRRGQGSGWILICILAWFTVSPTLMTLLGVTPGEPDLPARRGRLGTPMRRAKTKARLPPLFDILFEFSIIFCVSFYFRQASWRRRKETCHGWLSKSLRVINALLFPAVWVQSNYVFVRMRRRKRRSRGGFI